MATRLSSQLGPQLARTARQLQPNAQSFKRAATTGELSRIQEVMKEEENFAMSRNLTRTWKTGDVYAPHDLSGAEAAKWKKRYRPTTDAFDALSVNPLTLYKVSDNPLLCEMRATCILIPL